MNKNIAITVALVVVLLAFGSSFYKPQGAGLSRDVADLLPPFSFGPLQVPTLENSSVKALAWDTWERYLEAAKAHDLETIKSLSHQTSPACQDPTREAECDTLMDNVSFFGSIFKAEDFTQVFADNKQIIMMTDFQTNPEIGPQSTQIVLFFTRDANGTPKVLSMRFCFKDQVDTDGGNCVETDPAKRDLDNNGWWDSVEELFYQ